MPDVLVFAEQRNGQFKKTAYEAVREGSRIAGLLGGRCVAAVLGSGIEGIAPSLGAYGADRVLAADHDLLARYSADGYSRTLERIVRQHKPQVVLLAASAMGKDLGPALAARLEAGLAADCVALSVEDGALVAVRPVYAGKARATLKILTPVQIASLRPNVFPAGQPAAGKAAPVEKFDAALQPSDLRAVVKDVVAASGGKKDLTESEVIVSGGRGLKAPENFKMVEELAEVLGGAVGASRAVVDAGWRPHAEQVGQTGKTVSPNLYIAIGISGAIQHLAGMSSTKVIVAINPDKDAPIFQIATYGIVGDAFQVVPALTQELRKALAH